MKVSFYRPLAGAVPLKPLFYAASVKGKDYHLTMEDKKMAILYPEITGARCTKPTRSDIANQSTIKIMTKNGIITLAPVLEISASELRTSYPLDDGTIMVFRKM